MTSRADWADMLLKRGGWPVVTTNRLALEAWIEAEGTKARFNPLATTQAMTGATNYNSTGVKNYASLEQGVEATYKTLTRKLSSGAYRYQAILAELKAGNSAMRLTKAVDASPWGTKLAYAIYLNIIQRYVDRSRLPIPE